MFSKTVVFVISFALLFVAGSILLPDWPLSATAVTATTATPAYTRTAIFCRSRIIGNGFI